MTPRYSIEHWRCHEWTEFVGSAGRVDLWRDDCRDSIFPWLPVWVDETREARICRGRTWISRDPPPEDIYGIPDYPLVLDLIRTYNAFFP